MTGLPAKIIAIHEALDAAHLPHAFGGALALAWCTQQARGTIDIDVNVFVDAARGPSVVAGLPSQIRASDDEVGALVRDGQVRLWWDTTPVDLFLNTHRFHEEAANRSRSEDFGGRQLPFLSCSDLAVFKVFFDRTRDWADLEAMVEVGSIDFDRVLGVLVRLLGPDDRRVERLRTLDIEPR